MKLSTFLIHIEKMKNEGYVEKAEIVLKRVTEIKRYDEVKMKQDRDYKPLLIFRRFFLSPKGPLCSFRSEYQRYYKLQPQTTNIHTRISTHFASVYPFESSVALEKRETHG